MFRFVLSIATLAIASLIGSQAAFAQNRVALVIGQSAYRSATPLPNPTNDAKMMAGLLTAAGFEVTAASDLMQNELRQAIGDFAGKVAAKGPNTVALVFYAGHGLQIDGENFLVPVDASLKREADVPLQSLRLNDVMNTLASVPTLMRIVMLDACRNNPFTDINTTAGKGLAIVDVRAGAAGAFISFSTSPGMEALDGSGSNSPYTSALLESAREPGLPIEEAFKRARVLVNKSTDGQQTPWESSSLTSNFSFFPGAPGATQPQPASVERTVADWRQELSSKTVAVAYEIVIGADTLEAFEAFVVLFPQQALARRVLGMLERRREMTAWSVAVIQNTVASYQAFLASYPKSDLSPTARKLQERILNRVPFAATVSPPAIPAAISAAPPASPSAPASPVNATPSGIPAPQSAALGVPMCPCTAPPAPRRAETPPPPPKKPPPQQAQRKPPAPPPQAPPPGPRPLNPNEAAAAGAIIGIGAGILMGGGRGYGGRGGHGH